MISSMLLETEADFTDDDGERLALYQQAVRTAVAYGLPTLSIRLSQAGLLLEMGRHKRARQENTFHCGRKRDRGERLRQLTAVLPAADRAKNHVLVRPDALLRADFYLRTHADILERSGSHTTVISLISAAYHATHKYDPSQRSSSGSSRQ